MTMLINVLISIPPMYLFQNQLTRGPVGFQNAAERRVLYKVKPFIDALQQ